jgi:RNA polymerase sigma-70 factor (ECF subfamily)
VSDDPDGSTSASLLERARNTADDAAWERIRALYTPLLYFWIRKVGLHGADADDVVQEVLVCLVQQMPEFHYDPTKTFRGWLRGITLNKCREQSRRRRRNAANGGFSDLERLDETSFADREYRDHLVATALSLMQRDFETNTWRACWEHVVMDRKAADVARELGMTENAVFVASSRVVRRLRQQLAGLLE